LLFKDLAVLTTTTAKCLPSLSAFLPQIIFHNVRMMMMMAVSSLARIVGRSEL
jgi:hypothetical protein